MKSVFMILLLASMSIFSQEMDYETAENFLINGDIENASIVMEKAIKKSKINKSKYYQLYGTILKRKNSTDSCLYYYNLAEQDYLKRNIRDSLLLVETLKLEFYRFYDYKKKSDYYIKKMNNFNLERIDNKNIVAFALNRKMAVFSLFHFGSQDTIQLIQSIGKQIIDLENQITKKEIVAYTLNELALNEDYRGNKPNAKKMYENALLYARKNNLANPEIDVSFVYAQYCARYLLDTPKAIAILKAVENKILKGSNLYQKEKLYNELRCYYYEIGSYKVAYETFDQFLIYFKEVDFNESKLKLNTIEKKFDLAQKQKEIQEKENKIKIQDLEIESSEKRFWLISIIFFTTVLGSAALYYIFKREQNANKKLRILSRENDFLMSEANHRINNNLQLIIILMEGQIEKIGKKDAGEIKKILVKINSIATLHKHLYKSKNKKEIDIQKYLKDIESSFLDLFAENNIISNFSTQQISLIIDDAMYVGLILTELYINSIKHAFAPDQLNKQIVFSISLKDEDFIFSYKDNGQSLNRQPQHKPALVDQLCRQLEVSYEISFDAGFELVFKKHLHQNLKNTSNES